MSGPVSICIKQVVRSQSCKDQILPDTDGESKPNPVSVLTLVHV